ncbi:DUF3868 domain-containing protein [uncultured Alistipes sp.]|jgi:hypothetical protein|uniref:DUF3868 domain-containing protein n=1 Tax=uncultured Alistipes sp. TaxID=538949 RepID=UPI0025E1EE2B|nr:DUF3868 domain-containing protein [uncultured Alistipes sp.]
MKKVLSIFLLTIIACTGLRAQNNKDEITITQQHVEKTGERVNVTFHAEIGRKAARSGRTVVFVPSLTDGTNKWTLPAIVVQGRRAKVTGSRHDWAAGTTALQPAFEDDVTLLKNGSTLFYENSVDWQLWMHGADLIAETLTMGCCSYSQTDEVLLYGNAWLPPTEAGRQPAAVEVAEQTETPKPEVPKTSGEKLAERYPFILPASEFEKLAPGQLFDEDREGALTIYFKQGKYDVDNRFAVNERSLIDLMTSIRMIEHSLDSRVKRVVIAGFASPEGSFALNDRLAFDRAAAVKRYIMDHSGLQDSTISLYNGSEDWQGLRMLVEKSDLYDKAQILEIIDNVPIWDPVRKTGRESELMKLDGGRTYRYLLQNLYPRLRNAAYIKIYYEDK